GVMSYQGIYVTKEYPVHFEVVPGGLYLKNVLGTVFSWEGSNFRVRSFGVKSLGVF
ncbi:mCG141197, isoform CRA_a, partial [Mus musculus]